MAVPAARRLNPRAGAIVLEGAATHNLQDVDVRIPLGALVCVTGVSGSGKSSLVNETLAPAIARRLRLGGPPPGPHRRLRGVVREDGTLLAAGSETRVWGRYENGPGTALRGQPIGDALKDLFRAR